MAQDRLVGRPEATQAERESLTKRAMAWALRRVKAYLQAHLLEPAKAYAASQIARVPRRSWGVLVAALMLAGLADWLHHHLPWGWPLAVLIGGLPAAAPWLPLPVVARLRHLRWPATIIAAGATLWLAPAWAAGLTDQLALALLLDAGLMAAYVSRGARLEAGSVNGKTKQKERSTASIDVAPLLAAWPERAKAAGLPSERAEVASLDQHGATLRVHLLPGRTLPEAAARLEHLESALAELGARPGSLSLARDPLRPDRCYLRIAAGDVLARPISWPGPSITGLEQPVRLGLYDTGEDADLVLLPKPSEGVHILIAGRKGAGKSSLLYVLLGELAHSGACVLVGIDLKYGVELTLWRGVFERYATEVEEATALLKGVVRVLAARGRDMARRGLRAWDGLPLALVVDEIADLPSEGMKLLYEIARKGRAAGILLVLATQRPSASSLGEGGTDLRSQLDAIVAMHVVRADDGRLILGEGRTRDGWRPDRLPADRPGSFLLLAPGNDRPIPARSYRVSDEQATQVARQAAADRKRLDEVSRAALEEALG